MYRRNFLLGAAAAMGVLKAATPKADSGVRDRVFVPSPECLGIRVGLTIVRERTDRDLLAREAGEREVFGSGDRFRLRIQSNFPAVNHLVSKDADGKASVLLKRKTGPFEMVSVPEDGWLRMDDQPGIESLILISGKQDLALLETKPGVRQTRPLAGRDLNRPLAAITADTRYVFEEDSMPNGGDAATSYLIARVASDDEYLIRPLDLVHRRNAPNKL